MAIVKFFCFALGIFRWPSIINHLDDWLIAKKQYVSPEGIRIGEEVDSKSIAPQGVAGSSPVPSASLGKLLSPLGSGAFLFDAVPTLIAERYPLIKISSLLRKEQSCP